MSQEAFALHAGIARSYMSRIERGRAEPRFEALAKLAAAFRVTPSALFEPPTIHATTKRAKAVLVPFAADGTCFNPTLRQPKAKTFVVGEKSDRKRFTEFDDALSYLRDLGDTASWERPDGNGGRGIVKAREWKPLPAKYRS